VIAVLDTGVNLSHPEFAGKIIEARSFVPGEGVEDGNGHGTHTASTNAGNTPTIGVAYKAKLLIGKVLSNAGSGAQSWIQDGFNWAVQSGATSISISIGGVGFLDGMEPLFQMAEQKGVVVNVAMGNERQRGGVVNTPSSALLVAAVDRLGKYASFSNPGLTADVVSIAAPGVDILGAWPGGGYNSISGTSMATPFSNSVCEAFNSARVKLGLPAFKTSDFKRAFSTRAIDAGTPGLDRDYGPGLLNGYFLRNLLIPNPPEVK
jgi:subtilisin family serine protease